MSRTFPIYTVDSFTERPFSGNPAGVCLTLTEKLTEHEMMQIAAEMRHSETAFVTTHPDHCAQHPIFGLRWFTPTTEVNLCGHATLATAHVLFNEEKLLTGDLVLFETLSGVLKVRRDETTLQLDFPRGFPMSAELSSLAREKVLEAFGFTTNCILDIAFCTQTKKLILHLDKPSRVWAARVPQGKQLTRIEYSLDVRGIAIACSSSEPGWKEEANAEGAREELRSCDIVTRYFSPWNGIAEDPVNGSSHTILPYYYTKKLGKTSIKSYAASSRGGHLIVTIDENVSDRIFISGSACTVLQGTLRL